MPLHAVDGPLTHPQRPRAPEAHLDSGCRSAPTALCLTGPGLACREREVARCSGLGMGRRCSLLCWGLAPGRRVIKNEKVQAYLL